MNNKNSTPIKGCKGVCHNWRKVPYIGRHNVVNGFANGKVACSSCEILFDKSHLKNKKFCSCCGRQVRFKPVTSKTKKDIIITEALSPVIIGV